MSAVTTMGRRAVAAYRAFEARPPKVRVGAANGPGRIFYLTPSGDEPAGGVRVMYRHVDILNEAGFEAFVLHGRRGFVCTWFEHRTPVVDTASVRIGVDDLLVVPELYVGMLPSLGPGWRHVVFNQGPHLTFQRDGAAAAAHYATSRDLLGVLTVSEHGRRLLEYAFPHLDVWCVRNSVELDVVRAGDARDPRVITYMPRRANGDATLVLELLRARGALEGWTVRPLAGLTHREITRELRRSSIFLHFTYQEGFGLPAAEAMACGNLVIGFDGFGGREIFRPEFSRPVPAGDVLAFAQAVEDALRREEREPGWCRSLGERAAAHVSARHSERNEREDVLAFYRHILAPPAVARIAGARSFVSGGRAA